MTNQNKCGKCGSEYIYQDREIWVCSACAFEWAQAQDESVESVSTGFVVKDASGTILTDGDTVSVIKDLKVKGSSSVVKVGTKVKNIRLIESNDGHNISCKVDGVGAMNLKSEFVRKL